MLHLPAYILGWNIFDKNLTMGGLLGYSSLKASDSRKVPSSNGVSLGPKMTAFHCRILFSVGAPDTPAGGSSCSRLKSRISRRLAAVAIAPQLLQSLQQDGLRLGRNKISDRSKKRKNTKLPAVLGNYDRPTDQPTDQQTDMRGNRGVKLAISC